MNKLNPKLVLERRKLSALQEWDQNPRSINRDAFDRLKKQITKHGMYKPIIVDQNGVIIGGNMRFKALTELKVDEVDVIVHTCKNDAERLEIALSDNDRAGYYNETELHELVQLTEIDGELYSIDLSESKTISEIIDADPTELTDNKEIDAEDLLKGEKTHVCPECEHEFSEADEKRANREREE